MWIRRLAVAHWRGLDFELKALSPGLNLVFGPNESGKSRLVEALRFALFESSSGKSAHKKALATWGFGADKPQVTVEFELEGVCFRLEKQFLGTGYNTTLRSDGGTLEGAEAEDRLAALMGVSQGGRAEVKPEDRGIWSLLWVDQGASRDAPAHNEASQTRIHDQLTREIGEVAAGELGQQILRLAEEQRARFYTASRDAEKSTLSEPREKVTHLRRRLQEARERRDGVAAEADQLDARRAAARDLLERVHKAQQRLTDVRDKHAQATELGQRLELYDEQVRSHEAQLQRSRETLEQVCSLTARVEALTARHRQAAESCTRAEADRDAARQAFDVAAQAATRADEAWAAKEREVTALRRRRELDRQREQARRLAARLREAAQIEERLSALQHELSELPRVGAGDVERLRAARDTRDTAKARLEGASASVDISAHRDLRIGGGDVPAGTTWRVLVEDEQHVEVEGVMGLSIRPGGGELPRLRDAVNDAERALSDLSESLGISDVAHAERLAERRRELDADLTRGRKELQRHLPEGRETAAVELRELEKRLESAEDDTPVDGDVLEAAEAALAEHSAERDALRAKRDVAAEQLSGARETAAGRRSELASTESQLQEAAERRRALPDSDELASRLTDAERAWKERVAARDVLEEQFDALGGEDIELDLEQAEKACRQLTDDLHQVRTECLRLETRLESAGDDARHEQVQELEAELVRAESELAAAERHAGAARRLHEVLQAEYEAARERLARPVIDRIRPHLQSLFPGTEVWLDEDLNLKGLRGRDTDQNFEALSGGAREQLSLLVRIGLAEVVGAGESWPLVLDDVLVNTDAERIQRAQRVLYQASRHMQILLFTCHGPLFDALGADARIELPAPGRAVQRERNGAIPAG